MTRAEELFARVKPLAEEYAMFPAGGRVICALSGGVDSVALLHFLHAVQGVFGFTLQACHMNHGIRPEADADAAFVQSLCDSLAVPLTVRREDVPALAAQQGVGVEEAGRNARYRFFASLTEESDGTCVVATAHHADDNAETLLLNLLRGTGLNGLGGIPPRRGSIVRPFLQVPRALLEAYVQEQGLPHVEDSTNADPAYTRNFIRLQVMPLLRQRNPALTETLTACAATLRQDSAYLSAKAQAAAGDIVTAAGSVIMPIRSVTTQPDAIAGRVVQLAVEKLAPDIVLSAPQRRCVVELCRSADPGGHADLPRGLSAQRVYDAMVFSFPGQVEVLPETLLDFEGTRDLGPWLVTAEYAPCPPVLPRSTTEFYLAADAPILLRPRETGDTLKLPHRQGTKTLKKWMIEQKIPEARRDLIPVLEQNGRVAAAALLGMDESACPAPGTLCLHIILKQREESASL